jgi:uncharacterized protein (TIGR01777 family)
MRILITGGTGLVGSRLAEMLQKEGHTVFFLSRSKKENTGSIRNFLWNIDSGEMDDEAILQADAIIHLAGASIAQGRWTARRREELYMSRIGSTRLLYNRLKNLNHRVKTFISASATGYYGNGKSNWLTEDSPPGSDFLASLCRDWEQEAQHIAMLSIRTVIFRIGIVLSRQGGALPELAKSFRFGVAAFLGDGSQYLSWIHIDDLCRAFLFALKNENMAGVYNATSPVPATNREMTETIRTVKNSLAPLLPAPAFALRLALGEMSEALLTGQRCSSEKLMNAGFRFEYSDLKKALKVEL